ncbi:MAG: DUF3570 domain-containing protein [Deltaproteobacteria bacterium]|nr:DUF3570 domain-containing protein [Deltaproteobacteria bacterium]
MRLQLIGACVLLFAPAAGAQSLEREPWGGAVTAKVAAYQDDDDTTVVTSLVDGELRLSVPVAIGVHALVDAVSSASVDVVSAATQRWTEERVEAGLRSSFRGPAAIDASLGVSGSTENDWSSTTVRGSVGRDFAEKNTRLDLAAGYTANRVGRARDPGFEDDLGVVVIEAGATQLLDPRTLVGVAATLSGSRGFHASPYRTVLVGGGRFGFPETLPDERMRGALTVRVLRSLARRIGWEASYRAYADDWGVRSQTLASSLAFELGRSWDLRLRARGYYQWAAAFYREEYDEPLAYMTSDRELATFWDVEGGLKLGWSSGPFAIDAKADAIVYRFVDFARLEGRVALVSSLGAAFTW